ncbi:hypothetical protein CGJ36_24720 [Vibrio parahaemolyticus]|nr:hypothetical protein CGJ36_24720 [Vibrio parahaemolyticus]TOK35266.1 hypothetical protein CGI21_23350 [Vibrio parahaemolyticus]
MTKILTLNSNVKLEARVSKPTDKTDVAKCDKGIWEQLAAKKKKSRKRTMTKKLEPVNDCPTSSTSHIVPPESS